MIADCRVQMKLALTDYIFIEILNIYSLNIVELVLVLSNKFPRCLVRSVAECLVHASVRWHGSPE